MDNYINVLGREIRSKVAEGHCRCLAGFLRLLKTACWASDVGVVRFSRIDGYVEPEATGLAEGLANEQFKQVLQRILAENRGKKEIVHYLTETGEQWLVIRRVWPSKSSARPDNSSHWIYLLDPVAVLPPRYEEDAFGVSGELARLAAEWYRWRHEVLDEQTSLLSEDPDDRSRVLSELPFKLVFPVDCKQFLNLLDAYQPATTTRASWPSDIDQILNMSRLHAGCAACASRDRGVSGDNASERLEAIAGLYLWKTGFWKPRATGVVSHVDPALLGRAVQGLKVSVPLLDAAVDLRSADARTFLRFFVARAIEGFCEKREAVWRRPNARQAELDTPASLAELALMLLADAPWSVERVNALIQVVAEFGHKILDVPARLELARHLRQTLRGEAALHTLKQHYRDHFFHTIEVCLMGYALLQSYPAPAAGDRLVQVIINRCMAAKPDGIPTDDWTRNLPGNAEDFLAQWWVASLIHDVGYGVDILKGTLGLFEFFSNDNSIATFRSNVSKDVRELSEGLRAIVPELRECEGLGKDHGVVAAAHLNATLGRFGHRMQLRFQPATRAIAFHNMRGPCVDAGRDPVAALLILCDSLQEWRRAHLGFSQSPVVVLSRMVEAAAAPGDDQFGSVEQFRFSVPSSIMNVTGHAHAEHRWESADVLEVRLDYNDRVLRDAAVFFLWMDATYNLQRVDFRPWKLKLKIRYSTPVTSQAIQIDRLTDLVRDRAMKYAERWLEVATFASADAAISHRVVDGTREVLVMDLARLGEEFANGMPLLGGKIGDFFKDLWEWPPYAGERSLEDEYRQTPPI